MECISCKLTRIITIAKRTENNDVKKTAKVKFPKYLHNGVSRMIKYVTTPF